MFPEISSSLGLTEPPGYGISLLPPPIHRMSFRFPARQPFTHSCRYKIYDVKVAVTTSARDLGKNTEEGPDLERPVKILSIVGRDSISPLRGATWEDVMLHTAKRMKWVDEGYEMLVTADDILAEDCKAQRMRKELRVADILLIVGVNNATAVRWIEMNSQAVSNIICFESAASLQNKLGGLYIQNEAEGIPLKKVFRFSLSQQSSDSEELSKTLSQAWKRHNVDDIRFCLLVIINAYIRPVPILQNLRPKGFSTLTSMMKKCAPQILNCLMDPTCRKALQCMSNCNPLDQVCNYRCIATYDSQKLEAMCSCILQKHNCLGLDATIPEKPYVPPLLKFRGEELSHEMAEDLLVGWLGRLDWSWRVVAGQNPAYDHFPCQYQLFYRGKANGSLHFEPIFRVKTEEGNMVWKRHLYRVKRGNVPGTFYFSVLYNGVKSNEFWTIVHVADDFSWGLFYYAGAAPVAGQSYSGAVLVSPDGAYPSEKERKMLNLTLEKCGIKEWELFFVDNCSCPDPPLGVPAGSRLHSVVSLE